MFPNNNFIKRERKLTSSAQLAFPVPDEFQVHLHLFSLSKRPNTLSWELIRCFLYTSTKCQLLSVRLSTCILWHPPSGAVMHPAPIVGKLHFPSRMNCSFTCIQLHRPTLPIFSLSVQSKSSAFKAQSHFPGI